LFTEIMRFEVLTALDIMQTLLQNMMTWSPIDRYKYFVEIWSFHFISRRTVEKGRLLRNSILIAKLHNTTYRKN
jgi:hypothetical protein